MEKNFTAAWQPSITEEEWKNFLDHTFKDNSRFDIYALLTKRLNDLGPEQTFAEIGFGQCFDFSHCFKEFHDKGMIRYNGFDVTEQFVNFALKSFPDYQFATQDFLSFDAPAFDVTYARHVLEHQSPERCYSSLANLLKRTKKLAIITWFINPHSEYFHWVETDGFQQAGAWVNIYDKDKVHQIIHDLQFKCETHHLNGDMVYILTKL